MPIKLVFLGKLADLAGAPDKEVAAPLDWNGLLDQLHGPLGGAVAGCAHPPRAHNGAVLADKTALAAGEGDEIALLPPVSGG